MGATNQQFTINDIGNGYYDIVNVNSGKCLDVTNSSTSNGPISNGDMQEAQTSNGPSQVPVMATLIINRNSGKSLDVTALSTSNGAVIQQYTLANGTNRLWQLTKL